MENDAYPFASQDSMSIWRSWLSMKR
ncbi:hypothetical protein NPIL_434271, partial [Nephila pilipes]